MPQADRRRSSVLIADDHAPVRRGIRSLLQDGGMRVVGEAVNGIEAVRLCDQLRPDVIVLDISMPLLDGFAVARQVTQLSPATKIIFLTGHSLQEYVDEALRIGGLGFVLKCHAARGLLDAIAAALEGRIYVSFTSAPGPVAGLSAARKTAV